MRKEVLIAIEIDENNEVLCDEFCIFIREADAGHPWNSCSLFFEELRVSSGKFYRCSLCILREISADELLILKETLEAMVVNGNQLESTIADAFLRNAKEDDDG